MKKRFLLLVTCALLLGASTEGIVAMFESSLIRQNRQQAEVALADKARMLSWAIDRRFSLMREPQVFTETNQAGIDIEFGSFAAGLHARTPDARNFAIAPDGIVKYVYPMIGNELIIGHYLLVDPRPAVSEDSMKAIRTRQIVISGPYELVQGGSALVARKAIYIGDFFWGLISMALDVNAIMSEAGLRSYDRRMDLAVTKPDGTLLTGNEIVFQRNPVSIRSQLPDGTQWIIATAPADGWTAVSAEKTKALRTGCYLVSVLLLAAAVFFNRRKKIASGQHRV